MRSSCAAECLLQPRFAQIGQVPLTILRSFPVFKATRLFHGDSGIELQDRINLALSVLLPPGLNIRVYRVEPEQHPFGCFVYRGLEMSDRLIEVPGQSVDHTKFEIVPRFRERVEGHGFLKVAQGDFRFSSSSSLMQNPSTRR